MNENDSRGIELNNCYVEVAFDSKNIKFCYDDYCNILNFLLLEFKLSQVILCNSFPGRNI